MPFWIEEEGKREEEGEREGGEEEENEDLPVLLTANMRMGQKKWWHKGGGGIEMGWHTKESQPYVHPANTGFPVLLSG